MKTGLIFATFLFCSFAQASSDVFAKYQDLATTLAADVTSGSRHTERNQADLDQLISWGYEIMGRYQAKYSECKAQYAQIVEENEKMKVSTHEQLESRYHDGIGLIEAPAHCYLARSMVIHPYMVMAIFRERLDGAVDEIEEVANRAPKIKARLEH